MQTANFPMLPIFLFTACVIGLAVALLLVANLFNPGRPGRVKHALRKRHGSDSRHPAAVHIRFHLVAIAFLVFDVELLFLYPWAVAMRPAAVRRRDRAGQPCRAVAAEAPRGIAAAVPVDRGRWSQARCWWLCRADSCTCQACS